MTSQPLLRVSNLRKSFGSGETESLVLKGIDLSIERGDMAALVGPSGSGKSTLLSILGTLLRGSDGQHEMMEVDLMNADDARRTDFRSRHLGFVFQFHHLLPDLTAVENVVMPAALSTGRETSQMKRRAGELLEAVGLSERSGYKPAAMSGGQRQRVAVARALINAPALVLADEPTGNLDRASADQVMDLIRAFNKSTGTAFIISTHDERIAATCARRIELLDGRVVRTS